MKASNQEIPVLDKGFVALERVQADDLSVVNSAKVSFNQYREAMQVDDDKLISYLVRQHHGTPFEHNFFCFRIKAPIFVFREWHRHRIGHSYNEWSARYSMLKDEFYVPENVRVQKGKPGAYTYEPMEETLANNFRYNLVGHQVAAFREYEAALALGVAKEQARLFLPVSIYSEMYWSCNARSLMHFLNLRNSDSAQWEIRQYALIIEQIFSAVMPVTHAAFLKFGREAP
jgi:thymidylate synthase (FAD)